MYKTTEHATHPTALPPLQSPTENFNPWHLAMDEFCGSRSQTSSGVSGLWASRLRVVEKRAGHQAMGEDCSKFLQTGVSVGSEGLGAERADCLASSVLYFTPSKPQLLHNTDSTGHEAVSDLQVLLCWNCTWPRPSPSGLLLQLWHSSAARP